MDTAPALVLAARVGYVESAMPEPRRRRRGPGLSEEVGPYSPATPDMAGNVLIDAASGRVSCELPIEGSGGWYVSAVFLRDRDELVMAELKVFPGPEGAETRRAQRRRPGEWSGRPEALDALPDGGVSARLLRCIRLTDLHQLVADSLAQGAELSPRVSALTAQIGRPGGAVRSDRYYAEWAFAYAKKLAEGSRSPIKDLAAEHDKTQGQVRDLIHDARVRGLLTKERQGRAAGSLTSKAIQLLREEG